MKTDRKDKIVIFSRRVQDKYFLILLLIIFLGAFLRFYNLGEKSLWGDEINEIAISGKKSIDLILNTLSYLDSAPLDIIIIHIFLHLGKNEFIYRLPACIFGICGIFLVYKIGKITLSNEVGLISSFLLSTSIFHVAYSQEARMYALFCFLSLGSFLFLFKLLTSGKNIFCLFYTIFTLLSLYTHYFAIFNLITQIIFSLRFIAFKLPKNINMAKKLIVGKYFVSIFIIFLLYFPLIKFIIRRIKNKPIVTNTDINIFEYFNFDLIWTIIKGFSNISNLVSYLFLFFLIIGFFSIFKKEKTIFFFYSSWLLLPAFFILIFLAKINSFFATRYLIFILPAFLTIISSGIFYTSNQIGKIVNFPNSKIKNVIPLLIILSITIISFFHLKNYYLGKLSPRIVIDWKSAGNFLNKNVGEKDIVLVPTEGYGIDFLAFYFRPISSNHAILRDSVFSTKDNFFILIDKIPQNCIKSLNKFVGEFDNAWLVEWRNNKINKQVFEYLQDKSSKFEFDDIRILKVKSTYLWDEEKDDTSKLRLHRDMGTNEKINFIIYQSKDQIIKKIQNQKFIKLNEFITFLGYSISSSKSIWKRGNQVKIIFYWECKKRIPTLLVVWGGLSNQKNKNQFIDVGHILGEDSTSIKMLTTNYWNKDEVIIESRTIGLPLEFNAGKYDFWIRLWDPSSKKDYSDEHNIGVVKIE